MAEAFIKFLPSEDYKNKTDIHAKNMSGDKVVLTVTHIYDKCQKALWEYNKGTHIQHAFDFLTADERNFMQTGLTSEEWDALFPEEEESEEEPAF